MKRLPTAVLLAAAALGAPWPGPRDDAPDAAAELTRLRERVEVLELERDSLRERLAACERELAREAEARFERERQWLAYTRAVSGLSGDALAAALPPFEVHMPSSAPGDSDASAPPSAAELAQAEADASALARVRALLAAAGVRALDLLTLEGYGAERTGPVLFRMLDDRGRLAGSLFAECLRLEGSVAGRTLTLVLEDGYESHGGERRPFGSAGERDGPPPWRMQLRDTDPRPWLEDLEPLFGDAPLELPADDGRWDTAWVTVKLNELLRRDASAGWYRVRRVGGVTGGVLRDVHVELASREGALQRRLFADRLTLSTTSSGVVLTFEDGVFQVGDERTPFPGRVHRLFLPRNDVEDWLAACLPGLAEEPTGAAAARRER
ncbi:MAG TPA: hypothetical protein VMT18_16125 [Planctomycetota bacterium]|nr:hypothetical protein [Planctomycetota bacterium]